MIFFLLKPCLWCKNTPGQMPPEGITSHSDNYCSYYPANRGRPPNVPNVRLGPQYVRIVTFTGGRSEDVRIWSSFWRSLAVVLRTSTFGPLFDVRWRTFWGRPLTSAFGPLFDVRRTFVRSSRFRPSSAISITLEKSSRPCVGFYHQTTVYCHVHSFTCYSLYLIFYSFYFLYTSLVMFSTIFALSMEQTWLTFHCWLYTLCIIVYVTNKPWNLN